MKRYIRSSNLTDDDRIQVSELKELLSNKADFVAHRVTDQSDKKLTCYTIAEDPTIYKKAGLTTNRVQGATLGNTLFVSYSTGRSLQQEISATGIDKQESLIKHNINPKFVKWSNIYQLLIFMDIYFIAEVNTDGVVTRFFELREN